MSKFHTKRYSEYMKGFSKFFSNDLFDSMFLPSGNKPSKDLEKAPANMTVDELLVNMKAHIDELANLDYDIAEKAGFVDFAGKKHEEALAGIIEEVKNRFDEYKKSHEDFVGEDYRKFEYMTNVINTYDIQKFELERATIYNPNEELSGIDDIVSEYEKTQKELDDAIADFNAFREDADYDASFITRQGDESFDKNEISAETILEHGVEKIISDAEYSVEQSKKDEKEWELSFKKNLTKQNEDRIIEINQAHKNHDDEVNRLAQEHTEKRRELDTQLDEIAGKMDPALMGKLNGVYYDAIDAIATVDMTSVSPSIAAGGEEYQNGDAHLKWVEDIKDATPQELEQKVSSVDKKINVLLAEIDDDQQKLAVTQANIPSIEAGIKQIDDEINNIEKTEEYKKLNDEYDKARIEVANFNKVMATINDKGLAGVNRNVLENYGIHYKGVDFKKMAQEEQAEVSNFNKNANGWFFKTDIGKALANSLKELDAAINDEVKIKEKNPDNDDIMRQIIGDVLEIDDREYVKSHNGEHPVKDAEALGDMLNAVSNDLEGLKEFNGRISSKKEAGLLNDVSHYFGRLQKNLSTLASDAPKSYVRLKKAVDSAMKSFEALVLNGSAYNSLIALSGMASLESDAAKLELAALDKLQTTEFELKSKVSDLESKINGGFKLEKSEELLERKEAFKQGLDKAKEKVEELKASIAKKTNDAKYLKKANKVIDARLKINDNLAKSSDSEAEFQKIRNEIADVDKKYSSDITKANDDLTNSLQDIEKKYKKQTEIATANYKALIEDAKEKRIVHNKFLSKLDALKLKKDKLVDGATKYATAASNLVKHSLEAEASIADDAKASVKSLEDLEEAAYTRFINSPKSWGGNSPYFTNVCNAINEYKAAKDALPEQKKLAEDKLRTEIATYIEKRDKGTLKKTPGGQIRLDTCKQIVTMLDQKQALINSMKNEAVGLKNRVQTARVPEIKSELEENLLKKAQKDTVIKKQDNLKKTSTKQRETEEAIVAKFKSFEENVKNTLGAGGEYLANYTGLCVKSVGRQDNKGFTYAVACVFAANTLSKYDEKTKANAEVVDSLVRLFAKSPMVKDYTAKLVSGKLKPEEFVVEAAKPENIKEINTQAHKIKHENKPEKDIPEKKEASLGMH